MKTTKYLIYGTIVSIVLAIFVFNSCQKENNEVTTNIQADSTSSSHGMGCLILPESEYKAISMASDVALKSTPTSVDLSCPSIGNQGGEGSCVAWGVAYACRSISKKITSGASSYSTSTNIFSPEYVYNQIKVGRDCGSGAYVTSALNLLINQGVCPWSIMVYSDSNGCSTQPTTAQKTSAANYKIASYQRVTISESALKAQLALSKPIVIAGPVDETYYDLGNNQILTQYNSQTYLGGHCVCLVGYSDTKNAFKFQNSWGTSWGTSGYGWIDYSAISGYIEEAYVLTEN
jgi:C1A family cysteine protease